MIAVLHSIRSIHNVGSIFRTAEGAGFEKVYLCGITPFPIDELGHVREPFAKVSLGAERFLAWEKVTHAEKLLRALKNQGYRIFAVEQDKNAKLYSSLRLSKAARKKTVLVMGHERQGVSRAILKLADEILEIPMRGKKESLNVAVAFGIVAYHLTQ